jgi:diguanylate cyclase (GGDEF)-like protein/PAS domain S-box-containing protein
MRSCDALPASAAAVPGPLHAAEGLQRQNAVLQQQITRLEEALRAVLGGEVDALFIGDAGQRRLFTRDGADRGYRALIEQMGEGALTLTSDGVVAYANQRFAELLGRPLQQVIGTRLDEAMVPEARPALAVLLQHATPGKRSAELDLHTPAGLRVPVLVSVSPLAIDGLPGALGVITTDLTWQRRSEAAVAARTALQRLVQQQQRVQASLQASLAALRLRDSALGAISQGVLIADAKGLVTYMNRACEEITGYASADMIGRTAGLLQGADTDPEMRRVLHAARTLGYPFHDEILNYRQDGTPFWNELSVTPVFDEPGVPVQFVGVMRDVTARRHADAQLLLAAKLFAQSSEGFIVTDAQGNIVKVNPAFTAICGYTEADALGQNPRLLASGRHDASFFQAMWAAMAACGHWQGEIWNRRKDGSAYPQWLSMSRVKGPAGQVTHYIAAFSDITQRKQAEDSIRRLAHFDALTGLPNRALLNDRATHALQMSRRSNEPMALMFIDLDHFKNVNDTLGHDVGDLLLVAVAARFCAALREQDTLSRTGGDEFVLLLPGTDAAGAAHVAQKLLRLAAEPHRIGQNELTVTLSIGIALAPSDGADYGALAKFADAAMYRAKQGGRNAACFYTAEIQARSARMLQLENALRRALERGELQLHYQPQTSLHDQALIGAEALLRWQHPELGWVSPAEFIPIAESSGLIAPIGEWVLRTALAKLKAWTDAGMAPITMAVNISAVQFRQKNLPALVAAILQSSGVAARWLELELTESVAAADPVGAVAVIAALNASGVRMSIDDFGTGYSSLSYLKRFKVYKLKIDQSFVRSVTDDPDDQAIVSAIIHMARSLGLRTIAEGVETAAQMAYLRQQGCDEMQGYWLSRPLAPDRFADFVRCGMGAVPADAASDLSPAPPGTATAPAAPAPAAASARTR